MFFSRVRLPPVAMGRVDVVAWGLSWCLKGLRVASWSSSGCSNVLQPQAGLFFLAGQQGRSRCLFLEELFLQRDFLALSFPISPQAFPCLFRGAICSTLGYP